MSAYHHDSISALAKSLRKQLAGRSESPTHVEWLQMLAKAAGSQNYQDWLKNHVSIDTTTPAIPLTDLRLRLNWHRQAVEVFEDRTAGGNADRRRGGAKRIFALFDIDIFGLHAGEQFIRVKASVDSSLYTGGDDVIDWLRPYVLPALADLAEHSPEKLTILGHVGVSIDRHVAEGLKAFPNDAWRTERVVHIRATESRRLQRLCEEAIRAAKDFDRVKERLWQILGDEEPATFARWHKEELVRLASYLDEFLIAESELFPGEWNQEKFGGIADEFRRAAARPTQSKKIQWASMRQSVLTAIAPTHWNHLINAPAILVDSDASSGARVDTTVPSVDAADPDPTFATLLCGPGDGRIARVQRDCVEYTFVADDGSQTQYEKRTAVWGELKDGRRYGQRLYCGPVGVDDEVWRQRYLAYLKQAD